MAHRKLSQLATAVMATVVMSGCLFSAVAQTQAPNTLSPQEQADGWKLLFNGKNLDGWHSYHEEGVGKDWSVKHGAIVLNKRNTDPHADYQDIVTNDEFENFDFKVEWKAKPCIDSGVMFWVHESSEYKQPYSTGPEMQIADLACTVPDSRILMERSGDIFDLISDKVEYVKPAGEWNEFEIIANNGHVQLFQNGHKVIDTDLNGDEWKKLVAGSKFVKMPGFGTYRKGHISLQGTEPKGKPGERLMFRNIKIKPL
ncbi:MAG: 3-keto-disaccharide hydrolase [Acidobacteriaceae bacterium]